MLHLIHIHLNVYYLCFMKLRMRLILIFVSLSVLGLFFFQGYWLWNSYQVERRQIQRKLNETLQQAINYDLTLRLEKLQQNTEPGAPHGSVEFQIKPDSLSTSTPTKSSLTYYSRTLYQIHDKSDSTTFLSRKLEDSPMMRTAFKGIWQSINGFYPFDVHQVDSLWTYFLQNEGIYNAHFIDFTLGKDTLIVSSLPPGSNPTDLLATQKIGLNLDDSIGLQGFIISPHRAIFKQLEILLFASLFLILLITASYIYLIRTILKQKTIAQIKNDFVNNMTHELKTPITIAYSAIDALQTFNLVEQKETREEYFTLCRQQLKHLSGLVEKILSMALDERKNFRLQKEYFHLQPILDNLTQQFTLKAGKSVHFHIDNRLNNTPVYADKLHFTHVLSNLIDNAIKYSGPQVDIRIRAEQRNEQLKISISDNGIGISTSQQSRIFERFYRISHGNIHDVKGFGLGLSYVKEIIERHGGKITVSSKEKQGSIFTLLIPDKNDTRIVSRR